MWKKIKCSYCGNTMVLVHEQDQLYEDIFRPAYYECYDCGQIIDIIDVTDDLILDNPDREYDDYGGK